ncbi:serine/threonine protein kinase [Nocardia beijingensis]|uniref:serine/threonine-protein kinase n=1 Tax=Nocardia beijingensis TaxID=95162 RepID=UPI00189607DE|nr:serine/threonine-protein kinase [Nocardia beijingensis]MBF6463579.1 serine/threonine protein kinase [Nocardia beijingensis]
MTADRLIAGRYRLTDPIGTGAMGVVWRATDERLQRTVAVKQVLLGPGLTGSAALEAKRRAMREGRIAARLHHPNAITVFDVAEEDGQPWLVMEYLDAPSLAAKLSGARTLPPLEVARIGAQAASALAAAHDAGIMHRDVKPANLLVADDGTVKITDFGISRAVGDVTVTATGFLAGTPAYLSPEVARGEDPEPASDVFALGSTLYAAVQGTPPFGEGDNPLALLHSVARGQIPPPEAAASLGPVLMYLLAPAVADRPTMREAKTLLEAVAAGRDPQLPAAVTKMIPAPATAAAATTVLPNHPAVGSPEQPGDTGVTAVVAAESGPSVPQPVTPAPRRAGMAATLPGVLRGRQRGRLIAVEVAAVVGVLILVGIIAMLAGADGEGGAAPTSSAAPPAAVTPENAPSPGDAAGAEPRQAPAQAPGQTPAQASAASPAPTSGPAPGPAPTSAGAPPPPPAPGTTPPAQTTNPAPSTSPPPPSTTPQPTTSSPAPTTTGQATTATTTPSGPPTSDRIASFIQGYYGMLPTNVSGAWTQLAPGYQAQTGYDSYVKFWGTIRSVSVGSVTQNGGNRAVVALTYILKNGTTTSENRWIEVVGDSAKLQIAASGT